MPKVSVIIPCYNQGHYLDQAVDSVLCQTFQDLEIIIVNDGSTDELTNIKCSQYEHKKISVITTENKGLAAARNNGITQASGEYILPLDADDFIDSAYIEEAVSILDKSPEVGIVYCRAILFGAVETEWLLPDYSVERMLQDNIIFCTALYRKSDWVLVGGYDPGMVYGWEDYDFWLALIKRGRDVVRLDGRYFHYRVSADSMVRTKDKSQKAEMFKRIYYRHADFIGAHIEVWINLLLETQESSFTSRLYIDCGEGISDENSVARNIDLGKRKMLFPVDTFDSIESLRVDPVDAPACLELCLVELLFDDRTEILSPAKVSSNALFHHEGLFMFDDDDPQIYLDVAAEKLIKIKGVAITVNLMAVNEMALKKIISFQKKSQKKDSSYFGLSKWIKSTITS
ncbi:MAG: glycosyltransferase family 2 protein [Desulfobacterales bacterium]|nr:glycosyltransferase family 2 protein [Desulfobacterales bacterium]